MFVRLQLQWIPNRLSNPTFIDAMAYGLELILQITTHTWLAQYLFRDREEARSEEIQYRQTSNICRT